MSETTIQEDNKYANVYYKKHKMFVHILCLDGQPSMTSITIHKNSKEDEEYYNSDNEDTFTTRKYDLKEDQEKSVDQLLKQTLLKTNLFLGDERDDEEIENFIKQLKPLLRNQVQTNTSPYINIKKYYILKH